MNTSQRLSALLLLVATGASSSSWADSTAGQDLNLSVDPVLLIAIDDTPPSIDFDPPTVAGSPFNGVAVSNDTFKVAMTSNYSNARLYAKATQDGNPVSGIQLRLQPTGFGGGYERTISDQNDFGNSWLVGNIATGTLTGTPQTTKTLRLGAGMTGSGVPPYGSYTILITYTLGPS